MSPISSYSEEKLLKSPGAAKSSRKLIDEMKIEDYQNSLEDDQCEFLLNEETIKLSSKVCGRNDTFNCYDLKNALNQSAEKDFDKMLDSFDVKKSGVNEKMLQSLDSIKQRHSLINIEKQREEKQQKEFSDDNKDQYGTMNVSERLLRRSRLYDDVNLQFQKSQSDSPDKSEYNSEKSTEYEQDERFKTIKLRKKLQSGMVIIDPQENNQDDHQKGMQPSPGTNKEIRNKLNQMKQDLKESSEQKVRNTSVLPPSSFGFSRPLNYRKNELDLPLKTGSIDCLEQDTNSIAQQIKSPMGVKSKSIHNLIFNSKSTKNSISGFNNNKLGSARSQSNLKLPRPVSSAYGKTENDHFKVSCVSKITVP